MPAATFHIGRGMPGDPATPSEFNWAAGLQDGDTVKIHCRTEPYRSKWTILFNANRTALKNVTIEGVPTQQCQRPVIEGAGARPPAGQGQSWAGGAFNRSILQIGEPGWVKPERITLRNLEFRGTLAPDGSATPTQYWTEYANGVSAPYATNAGALRVFGKDITIESCKIAYNPNGIFVGSKAGSTDLSGAAENITVRGTHFFRNAPVGQVHQIYAECIGILVENSVFEQGEPTGGNNIKDRCAGSVYRYNRVVGGNQQFDFVQSAIPIINGQGNPAARDRYDTIFLYGNVILRLQSPNPNMIHLGFDSTATGGACYQKQPTNCDGTGRRNLFAYHNAFVSTEGLTNLFTLSSSAQYVDARNNYVAQRSLNAGAISVAESYGYAWPARVDWYNNSYFDDSSTNPNGTRFRLKASSDVVVVSDTGGTRRSLAEFAIPALNSLPLPNSLTVTADQMAASSGLSFTPVAGSALATGAVSLASRAFEINPTTGTHNLPTMQAGYPGVPVSRVSTPAIGPFDVPVPAVVSPPPTQTPPAPIQQPPASGNCTSATGAVTGLAGYWKLDETNGTQAADSTGISGPGTVVGSPARIASGKHCGALLFSGTNQYADLGNSPALWSMKSVTVSAWFKPSRMNDWQALVVWDSGSWDLYRLSVKDSGWEFARGAAFTVRTNRGLRTVQATKTDWDTSRWYLLTGTFNDATKELALHIDGSRVQAAQFPGESMENGGWGYQRAMIGGEPGATAFGGIDDVRIYNRALTATEVSGLAGGSSPAAAPAPVTQPSIAPAPLLGHWKLDESSGSFAADSSGSGTTGTLIGGAVFSPAGGRLKGALVVSGSGYADLGSPPALPDLTSITVSCWFQPTGANDWKSVIAWDSGSFDYFQISVKDSGSASLMGASFSIQTVTGEPKTAQFGKADWNPASWYLLTGTFDGVTKELRIYLNGALAGSATIPGAVMGRGAWGAQRAYIGGEPGAGLRGAVDDVRIYGRALTASEVQALFQSSNP